MSLFLSRRARPLLTWGCFVGLHTQGSIRSYRLQLHFRPRGALGFLAAAAAARAPGSARSRGTWLPPPKTTAAAPRPAGLRPLVGRCSPEARGDTRRPRHSVALPPARGCIGTCTSTVLNAPLERSSPPWGGREVKKNSTPGPIRSRVCSMAWRAEVFNIQPSTRSTATQLRSRYEWRYLK